MKCALIMAAFWVFALKAEVLTEKLLLDVANRTSAPSLLQAEAKRLAEEVQYSLNEEKFGTELTGKMNYSETKEKGLNAFSPVFTPIRQSSLEISKKLKYGASIRAGLMTDQRSAVTPSFTIDNGSTASVFAGVEVDLWKNLFGRIDRSENLEMKAKLEAGKIEEKIQKNIFLTNVRRTYWGLVANDLSQKATQGLYEAAMKQTQDAKRRKRNSISDDGEVARYESQVASRKGKLLLLSYEKENLIKQLKNLLPSLAGKDINLGSYSVDAVIPEVLQCTNVIDGQKGVPYQYTAYDELLALLKESYALKEKQLSRYNHIDIKFRGEAKTTGVDTSDGSTPAGNMSDAFQDFQDHSREGVALGIEVTIPLGGTKSDSRRTLELLEQKKSEAQITQVSNEMSIAHQQLKKTIHLLKELISTEKLNSQKLRKRISVMKKKYSQARISVNELITDQDSLLQSNLTTIDIQLKILNTIFDYFTIFPDIPCSFNHKTLGSNS